MPIPSCTPVRLRAVALVLGPTLAVTAGFGLLLAAPAAAVTGPVVLGSAEDFAVLAGSTVTNTGPSVLTGDLGVSPGTSITGFPPGIVLGSTHVADTVADDAQTDTTAAFVSAGSRPAENALAVDPSGQVLTPGVYDGGTLLLTGTLTLDGGGDPNAVFLLRLASTLDTGAGSVIALTGGAQACNVFFQVGSSATLGASSLFRGTILALASVSTDSGATVDGRLLARTGAVTLIDTDVTRPVCAAAVTPSPTTSPTTAPTTSPGATPTAGVTPDPGTSPTSPAPVDTPDSPPASAPADTPVANDEPVPTAVEPTPVPGTSGSDGSGTTGGGITTSGDSSTGDGVPELPRTGQDSDELLLLGVLAVLVGGVVTAAGRTPYAPRHAARRRPARLA